MGFQAVYVIDGARSPFLKARSGPGPFAAADLAVQAGRALLLRQPFAPQMLDEVILGCASPAPEEVNIARVAAMRLGRAKVIGMYTRLTPEGYVAELTPAWDHYPTDDVEADTARMNRELESYINTMPGQYYWVHKRFKTRPEGQPPEQLRLPWGPRQRVLRLHCQSQTSRPSRSLLTLAAVVVVAL